MTAVFFPFEIYIDLQRFDLIYANFTGLIRQGVLKQEDF
jgi:hypothetical protein